MQSAIAVGDEVMLTSGVFGTVTALEDDRASLEVATGVVISVARGAIGQVVAKPEDTAEPQQAVEPDAHPTDKSTGVDAGAEEN
jgi:preprotein translocase subunit YajC